MRGFRFRSALKTELQPGPGPISAVVPQTYFRWESSCAVAYYQLFSQARFLYGVFPIPLGQFTSVTHSNALAARNNEA